jgi:Holliday junction resolvase RusA-like endonuclease
MIKPDKERLFDILGRQGLGIDEGRIKETEFFITDVGINTANRPRVANRHAYYLKSYQLFRELVIVNFKKQNLKKLTFEYNVELKILCCIQMPISWSKKRKAETIGHIHTSKPDFDNMSKSVSDCLTEAGVISDDALIWNGNVVKRWYDKDVTIINLKGY